MNELLKEVAKAVMDVKAQNPMAPSITNSVTINFVANAQLAVGGSAAMVYLPDEGELMAQISKSVYINLGTMFPWYEQTIPATTKALNANKRNWVFDPCAVGIGSLRTKLITDMKETKPQIIRGNASEIISVASMWGLVDAQKSGGRGVDSTDEVESAKEAAKAIASFTGGAVAVSGKVDLVTDGKTVVLCHGGSEFLPMITGAGCSLGGVCAIYACVATPFVAALAGTIAYNEAAIRAEKNCKGPGSFQQCFLDELYLLNEEKILNTKIEVTE